ncbi:MAG: MlaD family protein [Pseudomonadota bacterium]|nr:MlaD family protein [Pseudomonadota bacterium]
MKKEPNKKAIGLFLVIGFTLFFGLIGQSIWQKIRADEDGVYVMYFHESIQGLSEGSPVVFQGVEVGKVIRIRLVADPKDLQFQIPVYIRMYPFEDAEEASMWEKIWQKDDDLLNALIERGLRARLATQSLLTGQLGIELVMLPDTKIKEVHGRDEENFLQIPTVLSKTEELSKGLDKLELQAAVTQFNRITELLGKELPVLLPAMTKSAESLDKTMSKIAGSSEETISNFNKTLQDVSDAAKSLQNLTDYLERHPEALIKGKKGE